MVMPSVDFQHIEDVLVLRTVVESDKEELSVLATPTPRPTPMPTPSASPTVNLGASAYAAARRRTVGPAHRICPSSSPAGELNSRRHRPRFWGGRPGRGAARGTPGTTDVGGARLRRFLPLIMLVLMVLLDLAVLPC